MPSPTTSPSTGYAPYEVHDLQSPEIVESIDASNAAVSPSRRGVRWVRAHWKAIALVGLGLLALTSRRARPLFKSAVGAYVAPVARTALARVRA